MEMRGGPVSCPVCTLYLREGVTLQNHLNTHPKDQVIAALVKISSGDLRYKLATAAVAAPSSSQELPVLGRSTPSVSAQFSQPSSSHFTTAITYQHFLSSNGVPQYVPLPAVITETATTPAPTNQTSILQMVYQPYMMQQQQQLQLLNSISPPPQTYIRHVLTPSGIFSPSNMNTQAVELSPASLTINIPFQMDNVATEFATTSEPPTFQTTPANNTNTPLSSTLPIVSVASTSVIPCSTAAVEVLTENMPEVDESETSHEDTSVPSVRDEEQQTEGSSFPNDQNGESYDIGMDDTTTIACVAPCREGKDETTQTVDLDDDYRDDVQIIKGPSDSEKDKGDSENENANDETDPSEETTSETEDANETQNHNETQYTNGTQTNDAEMENANVDEDNESDVESDSQNKLHVVPEEKIVPSGIPLMSESGSAMLAEDTNNGNAECQSNANSSTSNVTSDMVQISGLVRNALEIQHPVVRAENDGEYILSEYQEQFPETLQNSVSNAQGQNSETSNFINAKPPDAYTIFNIDGLQIAVPDGLVQASSSLIITPNEPTRVAETLQTTEQCDAGFSGETVLNIQTDETMPPKGELSEQESVGGNDTFPWTQSYDGPTACDLLARESWEASDCSDVSDVDVTGDSDSVPSQLQQEPSEPHQESTTYPLKIETVKQEKMLPLKLQLIERLKQKMVYACGVCDEKFKCPKERRVHQNTCQGNIGESTAASMATEEPSELLQESTCPLPLKLQLIQRLKQQRVYACIVCNVNFKCPKERRVHQNTCHVNVGESNTASMETEEVSMATGEIAMEMETKPNLISTVIVNAHSVAQGTSSITEATEGKETKRLEEESMVVEISKAKTTKQRNSTHGYLCSKCPEIFSSLKLRAAHESKTHQITKDVKNVCKTCNKTFENYLSFREHLQIHPLECSHCGKCFNRRQNLDLHIRRHLDIKPHKCTLCDKAFVTKQKLAEHINSHTGNSPIKCPMCDETFRRYSNLIQHKNRHHLKKKKKIKDFICRCGEIFHSKKKLEWHKETHDINPKRCKYCTERFVHVSSLTRHIRKAHDSRYVPDGGRISENVECNICGFVFLKGSMQVHMRMHRGERPFSCHECGKDFTTKWNLQSHRWTHAARSAKPYKCNLCKSAFFRFADLTAHENSHRNVRPYTCNHCGSRFIRKYNCLRHVREHETGKTFRCTVCGKTFHRSYYLKEHLRVHTGIRPFTCHICGKSSTTKSNHNKHVKIHHAREQVNTEG